MRDLVAYHEAGHAVVAWAMGYRVHSAHVKAEGGCECVCADPVEGEGKFILCFAGPAAQRKHGTYETWHGGHDLARAVEIGDRFSVSDDRVSKLIDRAHELVAEHWPSVGRVAEALIERGALDAVEIEALLGPTPDRVKLTHEQRRCIIQWAERVRLVEAVRLFGSRAKGFALPNSDVDLAVTASDANYDRFDVEWGAELANDLSMRVRLSQYRSTGPVRDYCTTCSELLFERPPQTGGFKRPGG